MFKEASNIISYSKQEQLWFTKIIGNKSIFLKIGSDINFFNSKTHLEKENIVVSVGADPYRDFNVLINAAKMLPNLKFIIVTQKWHISPSKTLPKNIEIKYNISYKKLRIVYQNATISVITTKKNLSRVSGQLVFLDSIAMHIPVIIAKDSHLIDIYRLNNKNTCLLYKAENVGDLVTQIQNLISNKKLRNILSQNAYQLAQQYTKIDYAKTFIQKLFLHAT